MKIIVQAGGLGTRMRALTTNKPKALIPVKNSPILFHLLGEFNRPEDEFITSCLVRPDFARRLQERD